MKKHQLGKHDRCHHFMRRLLRETCLIVAKRENKMLDSEEYANLQKR